MSIHELASLWELCFGDSRETALEFFSVPDVVTLTEEYNGVTVAMASLVPVSTSLGQNGVYVYGVCVHPEHRGKGLFRKLMERCEKAAADDRADFLCLIPADVGVLRAYQKMGYTTVVNTASFIQTDCIQIFSTSSDFNEFAKPECEMQSDIKYGLLKPINNFDVQNKKYHFLYHMGEC